MNASKRPENDLIEARIRSELRNSPDWDEGEVYLRPGLWTGVGRISIQVALILGCPFLAAHLSFPQYVKSVVIFSLGPFIASRLRALALILHDAIHSSIASTKKQNLWLGRVASVFLLTSFEDYRTTHLSHHENLGNEARDHDFNYRWASVIERGFRHSSLKEMLSALLPYFEFMLFSRREPRVLGMVRIAVYLAFARFCYQVGALGGLFALFLLPVFVFYPIIRSIGDLLEHGTRPLNAQGLMTFNYRKFGYLRRLFVSTNGDDYHLAHHLFPSVPDGQLKKLNEVLNRTSQTYRSNVENT